MKHIRKFNEVIKNKDLQETIDEILDNLSKKGSLSKSEKKFMDEAAKGTIRNVTTPSDKPSMGNPHDLGVMWVGKSGIHELLKSLEDEEEEELEKTETSQQRWERHQRNKINKMTELRPGLKEVLNEFALEMIKIEEVKSKYYDKLKSLSNRDLGDDYNYRQNIDGIDNLYSLLNRFGYVIDTVKYNDDGELIINNR